MKRLLAVFAHPDDESMFAGTLATYARQGAHVALASATRGEAGESSDASLVTSAALGKRREEELRCACSIIGVETLRFLDYCDSGMDGTPENDLPTAFIRADPDEVRCKLVKLMREVRPHVVITFEPRGWYGHPDHIAAGRYTGEAYHLSADPAAFPETGPAWRPARLFHAAFLRSQIKSFLETAREHGLDTSDLDDLPLEEPDPLVEQITHRLDASSLFELKDAAMRCHRTQFGEENLFVRAPVSARKEIMRMEHYIQVDPSPGETASPLTDLFAGIPE